MQIEYSIDAIQKFLCCETPTSWVKVATKNIDTLLIDHAHCEKKAASSAMNLIFHYPQHYQLMQKMSRIVREEMRHFEQVLSLLAKRNLPFRMLSPSRYAQGLRKFARHEAKNRLIDLLIIGAFVEARSCERFSKVAPFLEDELQQFYLGLLRSEARHFEIYLDFAKHYSDTDIDSRIEFFAQEEKKLILMPDEQFRFHSGAFVTAGTL